MGSWDMTKAGSPWAKISLDRTFSSPEKRRTSPTSVPTAYLTATMRPTIPRPISV